MKRKRSLLVVAPTSVFDCSVVFCGIPLCLDAPKDYIWHACGEFRTFSMNIRLIALTPCLF